MNASAISWKVEGSLGGPNPDGLKLRKVCPHNNGGEQLLVEVGLSPWEARQLWGRLGDELRKFDEAAGEPSN